MRAAIYWAPTVASALWQRGCVWLGRDAETGATLPQPDIPGITELTRGARRYGFHCTLRPPMRLATGWDAFRHAARRIAAATRSFALPTLELRDVDGFLALTLTRECAEMRSLAARCVRETEPYRQQESAAELARRRAAGLSPRQHRMLRDWGYPYVLDEWFFHLTLTRRLTSDEMATAAPAAARHFAEAMAPPPLVDEICVFTQTDGEFLIAERHRLGGDG